MTTVSLQGMKFRAYHGFYPSERKTGNDFEIDVHVDVPRFDSKDDNIQDTVNYEKIYEVCQRHMDKKYKLLETVALHIATDIKNENSSAQKVTVVLSKIGPQLGGVIDRAVIRYSV